MAASPRFKVFDSSGVYQAACHEIEAASVVVTLYGEGATIRDGHAKKDTVWTEGLDGCASDNYDHTGETVRDRMASPKFRLRWE